MVPSLIPSIKLQHILRNFDNRFALRNRTNLSERLRVTHDPTLCDVGLAVGAVGSKQSRRVTFP